MLGALWAALVALAARAAAWCTGGGGGGAGAALAARAAARTSPRARTERTGRRYVVTGGHGLVGSHVVEALLARGEDRVVVFDAEDSPLFGEERRDGRVTFVRGDLRLQRDVDAALEGADSVVHAAAVVDSGRVYAFELRRMHEVNVVGTANVVRAARRAGVTRLVFVSSVCVVLPRDLGSPGAAPVEQLDERAPYAEEPFLCHYVRTKMQAERVALKANGLPLDAAPRTADEAALRSTAVRPSGIYGPRDRLASYQAALGTPLVTDPAARVDAVYVENVVHAVLLLDAALGRPTSPVGGQAYFVSTDDGPRPVGEIDAAFDAAFGRDRPRGRLSAGTAAVVAACIDTLVWLTRGRACAWLGPAALMRPATMRLALNSYNFSNAKAARDFAYKAPFTFAEGVAASAAFWRGGAGGDDGKKKL